MHIYLREFLRSDERYCNGKSGEADGESESRGDTSHQKSSDGVSGERSVNYYHDAWRDELSDVTGSSDHTVSQVLIISIADHFGSGDLGEYGSSNES